MGCIQSKSAGNDKPLGLSVYYLATTFMDEVKSREGLDETSKIYEIENIHETDQEKLGVIRSKGKDIICPRDGKIGAAYVDCLEGDDNVGPSTFMLSYCWGYTIGDIVDTLVDYCVAQDLDMKRSYVWICCLCNNQHRVSEMNDIGKAVDFEEFQDVFYSRVTGIKHILAMMDPCEKPFYLTRVWCIFELYTANSNEECTVTVVMPPRERIRLVEALQNDDGTQVMFDAFADTKVENAQASFEEDRVKILSMIDKDPGYDSLNVSVNKFLRSWVSEQIFETAEYYLSIRDELNDFDMVVFLNNIGVILSENGHTTNAMILFKKSLEIDESREDRNVQSIAKKYINMAETLRAKGLYDEALESIEKAVKMLEEEFGEGVEDLNVAYNNAGILLFAKGDYEGAMRYYQAGIKNFLQSPSGELNPDVALLYTNTGLVYGNRGQTEMALEYHLKSAKIYEELGVTNSPEVATVHNNIGLVYLDQAKNEEALVEFQKALKTYLKLIGTQNDTLVTYNNIAMTYARLGKLQQASEEFEKAIATVDDLYGQKNGTLPLLLSNFGELKVQLNDIDGGLDILHKSEKAYINVFGPNHPDRAKPINNIALALSKRGEIVEAIKYQEKALSIFEGEYGEVHNDVAVSYNNLGDYHISLDKDDEGMAYFDKALKIYSTTVGTRHPLYGRTLNNIASAYQKKGDVNNALLHFKAAAEIYEETLNDGQFETVTILLNLSLMQKELGQPDEAIATIEKAITLLMKGDMPDKEIIMVNMNLEIAKICFEEGRLLEAILVTNGLWEDGIFVSKNSTQEAMAHFSLGFIYQTKEDYKSAATSYQKSFEIRKRILGVNDLDTATASNNVGLMKYYSGDYAGALSQHKYTIHLHESNNRSVEVALSYYNYGLALYKSNKTKKALSFLQRAYDIWIEAYGPEHENTKLAVANIEVVKQSLNE